MYEENDRFYLFIADSIEYFRKRELRTRREIAIELNVTESYINKIHQGNRHYNLKHIFVLSHFLNFEISDVFPTKNNLKARKLHYSLEEIEEEYGDMLDICRGEVE